MPRQRNERPASKEVPWPKPGNMAMAMPMVSRPKPTALAALEDDDPRRNRIGYNEYGEPTEDDKPALEDAKPVAAERSASKQGLKNPIASKDFEVMERNGTMERNPVNPVSNGKFSNLTPRSFSSDEDSSGPGAQTHIPKNIAFAQALREGYERRAQERSDWLKSLDGAAVEPAVAKTDADARRTWTRSFGAGKQAPGFNDTRRPQPALRDTDIMEQVRKWNVQKGAYREEVPKARPVRC